MQNNLETLQYFTNKRQLFYFKCRKNCKRAGIQNKVIQVNVSLRVTGRIKIISSHAAVFNEKAILSFSNNVCLINIFSNKSTLKLL